MLTHEAPVLDRLMMLSIHPRFVDQIVAGTKTVELRRTRPSVTVGQPVAIYATVPSAAVVATCRVTAIDVCPPEKLWDLVEDCAGIPRSMFDSYFAGSAVGVGIHLGDVESLEQAVTLGELRAKGPFYPPQTWRFFDRDGLKALLAEHPSMHGLASLLL
ncbi:ASCH domain-containing protein [Modestobacter sp. VKM Ac-2977]|uniref:ASCH domain-containing protein n=1 Tax=Modestobacter sp. VKM Ac-2977 TaxID=3004131 RepID=UPI0022AB1649|nr:ASCH domain-containing protein [Modestobacter sp. VKM Ac-2977]MCZ2819588.1 ASCH domain-containing protein [Modestobacter sp. VKM Ac-2977]